MSLYDDDPIDPFASPTHPARRLDDAPVPYAVLDQTVPLGIRWPDWRWLLQTDVFLAPGLPPLLIDDIDADGLAAVVAVLFENVTTLHAQAAAEEKKALSSATAWMYRELDIATVAACNPTAWLDTTPLMRRLRDRLSTL